MHIEISNFYSVKKAVLDISPGVNILAGKNGSGKSQILIAIANSNSKSFSGELLRSYCFDPSPASKCQITPIPQRVLWRPPVRNLQASKREKYATLTPSTQYINPNDMIGYTWNVEERFVKIYNTLGNLFVSGNINGAKEMYVNRWNTTTSSFKKLFAKEIFGEHTEQGCRVGLKLPDGNLTSFGTLSTGEQEFLSLFCDILTEPDVDFFLMDEIDTHFHPDLQAKIIKEIAIILNGRTLLATTHSPYVMLSAPKGNLFYLKHHSELKDGETNQVVKVSEDYEIQQKINEMYGCLTDKMRGHFLSLPNMELAAYFKQCLSDSFAISQDRKDCDPQKTTLRAIIQHKTTFGEVSVIEIGAGKGRIATSFNVFEPATLKKISYIAVERNEANKKELDSAAASNNYNNRFKSFVSIAEMPQDKKFDICILANVLHEISPLELPKFFSALFGLLSKGSTIIILEAMQLSVGEMDFVIYNCNSISTLFSRLQSQNSLSCTVATPISHNHIPLLEAQIGITTETKIELTREDVVVAINKVVEQLDEDFSKQLNNHTMDSIQFACKASCLANARGYLNLMKSENGGRAS